MKKRSAAAATLAAAIAGCALFQMPAHCTDRGDGICWWPSPVQIPVKTYTWEVDTPDNASKRCGYQMPFEHATCVMARNRERQSCDVVSALTEAQARVTPTGAVNMRMKGARSIFQHEIEDHCGLMPGGTLGIQWQHSEASVIPAGWRK